MAAGNALGSVVKTIKVLESFLRLGDRPIGPTQVATELGWSRASTHQYLTSLVEAGWLQQNATREYQLTGRASLFGRYAVSHASAPLPLLPVMDELVQQLGEPISFAVLSGASAVIVERREPRRPFTIRHELDRSMRLTESASGVALLAFDRRAPEELRKAIRDEVEQVRAQGFVYHQGEWLGDIVEAIGVPILQQGECLGALSVIAPNGRMDVEAAIEALKDARIAVEAQL